MKKLKKFNVTYNTTTSQESQVRARTKEEAIEKVKEVVGQPLRIEDVWELKGE